MNGAVVPVKQPPIVAAAPPRPQAVPLDSDMAAKFFGGR